MRNFKLNSKSKTVPNKSKNKPKNLPTTRDQPSILASLFELQQQKWESMFNPTNFTTNINSHLNHKTLEGNYKSDHNENDFKIEIMKSFYFSNDEDFVNDLTLENDIAGSFNTDINSDFLMNNNKKNTDLNTNINNSISNLNFNKMNEDDFSSPINKYTDKNLNYLLANQELEADNKPYYLCNFIKLLKLVCEDNFYDYLFNEDDLNKLHIFLANLSHLEKRLYVRLFLRKHNWLHINKINYDEFDDIDSLLQNLVNLKLLDDVNKMENLSEALHCLKLSDIKILCKNLHNIQASTKSEYISAIRLHSKSISQYFIGNLKSNFESSLLKKAKNLIGKCYRLNSEFKDIFMRIFTLASLQNSISDDDFSGQQLIFQMSLATVEQSVYPYFEIIKKSKIFENRKHLNDYCNALDIESKVWNLIQKKQMGEASLIIEEIYSEYRDKCVDSDQISFISNLPEFLRPFTFGGVFTRILNRGVNVLESLKNFNLAIFILKDLLEQKLYHLNYRGRWYDRLSLNLDFHMKLPTEAINYIKLALNDDFVKAGHRYNLLMRAKKICSSSMAKKNKLDVMWDLFMNDSMNNIKEAPLTYINGLKIPQNNVWLSMEDNSVNITLRVEQLVLQHYAKLGYNEGLHSEGITFLTLFLLFMWDVVFLTLPDVFINRFQDLPLDFRTNYFYLHRKQEIDDRLDHISSCSLQDLCDELTIIWNKNFNVKCSLLHWELFRDLNHIIGLVKCIGPLVLSSIFRRISIDNRHVYGGVPDLIVWNPENMIYKIIEVKGPNDKLSSKQILWLDYLLKIGVDAEVCHVKAIKRKQID